MAVGDIFFRKIANSDRLLAQSDTGQARRAANFLLSWWNAQNCGGFDLTDLWAVDKKVADDMLAAATFIAQHNEYPTAYGLGATIRAARG
jgi:hypothetical protein